MKRTIITTLTLVVMFLVSCVPQPTLVADVTTQPTVRITEKPVVATTTPTPADTGLTVDLSRLEGLQIRFLHPWTGATQDLLFQMVDQFNQTNEWGIHVIMTAPGSAAAVAERLNEELANDIPSNVIVAPVSLLLAIDEKHDRVIDLSRYVVDASYGLAPSLANDFTPAFWNEGLVNEKRLGIPAQRTAIIMAFNSSWAKELGFPTAPRTTKEFSQQVCAANASFRKDDNAADDGLGGWITNMESASTYSWLLGFGADPYTTGGYQFSTPAGLEAFTYLHELSANACAWVNRSTTDAERFSGREALVYSLWMQDLGRLQEVMTLAGSSDTWTTISYPGIEKGRLLTAGSLYSVLHRDAESDLAAWLFIRWLSQPAQQARLLQTMGTLPLGISVMEQMRDYGSDHPYWQQVVTDFSLFSTLPADADWQMISPMMEDAAWQLWMGGTSVEGIPDVLGQMDDLVAELSKRYP